MTDEPELSARVGWKPQPESTKCTHTSYSALKDKFDENERTIEYLRKVIQKQSSEIRLLKHMAESDHLIHDIQVKKIEELQNTKHTLYTEVILLNKKFDKLRKQSLQQVSQLSNHIIDVLVQHALLTNAHCPITFDLLIKNEISVTRCGHVFSTHALQLWLTEFNTCPVCRESQ